MTFKKGQSGNPTGRPKKSGEELELIAACKKRTPAALEVIGQIMESGENERNRLSAAQYIIDRAYGKAVQQTELTGKDGEAFTIQILKFSAHADDPTKD